MNKFFFFPVCCYRHKFNENLWSNLHYLLKRVPCYTYGFTVQTEGLGVSLFQSRMFC